MRIKKGDTVKVLSGDDKNKVGKVLKVFPSEGKLIVEGVALVKKHKKNRRTNEPGSIVVEESRIYSSKVAFYDDKRNEVVKIGVKYNNNNKLQRYDKKTGEFIQEKSKEKE